MWFTPVRTLETFVICGQLCGEGHGNMVGTLEVIEAADFDSWEKSQTEAALSANKKESRRLLADTIGLTGPASDLINQLSRVKLCAILLQVIVIIVVMTVSVFQNG